MGCPAFDPFGSDYLADPYPVFAGLRAEAPVRYEPGLDHFVVSRYEDIRAVLADPATYSARNALSPLIPFSAEAVRLLREGGFTAPHLLVNLDPPEHTRARRAASRAFTPRRLAGLEPVVRGLVERHLDGFPPGGPIDIVAGLAYELPAQVLFVLLGIPEEDVAQVKAWGEDRLTLTWGRPQPDEQLDLTRRMVEFWHYCERLVESRQADPGDDLPSELLREGDEPLSALEVATVVYGLLFAGHETTTNLLANSVRHLLARPGVWDRLRSDPGLIPNAVEEVLRLDSSVPVWRRVTTRPVELGGMALPDRARLLLLLGSANHDEAVFEAPEELDLERPNPREHLAFGFGIHFCLGAALARLEVKAALEVLVERLPGLRLTGGQELEFHPNLSFRGPTRLLIEWSA